MVVANNAAVNGRNVKKLLCLSWKTGMGRFDPLRDEAATSQSKGQK